jgi:hypothetical protein
MNMVRVTNDNKVYVKILFWGIKGAGKNTAADLLYDGTKEGQKKAGIDLVAVGERTRMPIGYDEGLFSDRGIFQSTYSGERMASCSCSTASEQD